MIGTWIVSLAVAVVVAYMIGYVCFENGRVAAKAETAVKDIRESTL